MDVWCNEDGVRNEHIRGTTRVTETSEVTEKRLKWYGQIMRREEEHVVGSVRGGNTREKERQTEHRMERRVRERREKINNFAGEQKAVGGDILNELCYLVFNLVECCFFRCFFCCFFWCETRLHVATEPRDEARLNGDDAEDGGEGLERPGGGAQAPVPAGVEVREHRVRLCQRAEHDEDVEQLVTVEEVVAPTG